MDANALLLALSSTLILGITAYTQQAVVYEGGRLIIGDGSAAIENGTFVVQNGHITAIGRAINPPAGAARVNLAGKTVMPAMINVHVHIGYEKYTSWGAQNYTAENVLDHMQREAFYGTAVTIMRQLPHQAARMRQIQDDQLVGHLRILHREVPSHESAPIVTHYDPVFIPLP